MLIVRDGGKSVETSLSELNEKQRELVETGKRRSDTVIAYINEHHNENGFSLGGYTTVSKLTKTMSAPTIL